jgi:hypothetical protein
LRPDASRLTPAQTQADVDAFVATLERVHPDPYYFASRDQIAAARARLAAELDQPLARIDFYRRMARFVAAFRDAHTVARIPLAEWQAYVERRGLLFPLDVMLRGGAVRVTGAHLPDLPVGPGDRLLSVNGRSYSQIVAHYRDATPGSAAFQESAFAGANRFQLWLQGVEPPYELVIVDRAGRTRPARIPGATADALSMRRDRQAGIEPDWRFQRLGARGEIGYLDFRRMSDAAAFGRFLDGLLGELQRRSVLGLIIDLRNNGGGNSQLGEQLIAAFSDRPYRMAERKEWRVSREYREYLLAGVPVLLRWLPPEATTGVAAVYWRTPVGQNAVFRSPVTQPPARADRFRGPVCVLIGPYTFSSAAMTANAIGDFRLATLIGEEAGGVPNHFGEVYPWRAPNSGLEVSISSARFVRASGDAGDPRGVRPDIEVRQSDEDLARGVDSVRAYAESWVRRAADTSADSSVDSVDRPAD